MQRGDSLNKLYVDRPYGGLGRWLIKLREFGFLITHGLVNGIWEKLFRRLYSNSVSFGLRVSLGLLPELQPDARIPFAVRPLEDADVPILLGVNKSRMPKEAIRERTQRLLMVEAGFRTCYVAAGPDNTPYYMQWIIGPEQNEKLQACFNGSFPELKPDEALLEGAFTCEAFRGLHLMPAAMYQITRKAEAFGATTVITFVATDNVPSLKGCKRIGFTPYLIRRDKWRFFRRILSFSPLPDGFPYPFDDGNGGSPQQQPTERRDSKQLFSAKKNR